MVFGIIKYLRENNGGNMSPIETREKHREHLELYDKKKLLPDLIAEIPGLNLYLQSGAVNQLAEIAAKNLSDFVVSSKFRPEELKEILRLLENLFDAATDQKTVIAWFKDLREFALDWELLRPEE